MSFRILLTLIVVGFVVFCGWLVADSIGTSSLENDREVTNNNLSQGPQIKAADFPNLEAAGGPAKTVTLGSIDPNSGFTFQLELTSKGAAIAKATFSEFDDRDYKNPQPLVILSPVKQPDGSEILSMANRQLIFVQQGLQYRLHDLHWKSFDVVTAADGSQTARFEAAIKNKDTGELVLKLTKTYRVVPGSYHLDCVLTVENLSAAKQTVHFNLAGPIGIGREGFRSDMRNLVGGFLTSKGEIVSSRRDLVVGFPINLFTKKVGIKDSTLKYQQAQNTQDQSQIKQAKEELLIGRNLPDDLKNPHFLWAAISNKYFTAILRPVPDEGAKYCSWVKEGTAWYYNPDGDQKGGTGDETIGADLKIAPVVLPAAGQANSTRLYGFQLYIGPKDKDLFYKNDQYRELGFAHTITFMPCCCCPAQIIQPLAFLILTVMKWMYGFIGNYGIVIIILVFLMRLAMHPVTKKSQVSMNKFTKVLSDPEVQQIRKKYAKNQMEMNKRILAFQKERGLSPATPVMGMLPMMLQMPIWIALWSAVNASIDLRGAAFLPFWITDLSVPDALIRFSTITVPLLGWKIESLNLLPILMGIAFYLQQKLMPSQAAATTNPQMAQQQKMMMVMMPILFPLMLYKTASGVNLYIMSSVFAGVVEQYIIRKHLREKEQTESKGLVATTSKTGAKRKKKKPKPFYRI